MSSSGAKRQRTETGQRQISVGEVLNDLNKRVTFIENYLRNQSKRLLKDRETVFRKLKSIEDYLAQDGYETDTQAPRTGNTSSSDESSDEDSDEEYYNTSLLSSTRQQLKY